MKKMKSFIMAMVFGITMASADNSTNEKSDKTKVEEITASSGKLSGEETKLLISRLYEIRSLDRNLLTMNDKKILRKEVNGISEKLHKDGGVVFYLSGTAIIIIILLLILL